MTATREIICPPGMCRWPYQCIKEKQCRLAKDPILAASLRSANDDLIARLVQVLRPFVAKPNLEQVAAQVVHEMADYHAGTNR